MPPLTDQQTREFLIGGKHILRLGTVTPDGRPYVVPLWYDYDGEAFTVLGRQKNIWIPYVEQEPRVCLEFDTTDGPFIHVTAPYATAEIVDKEWHGEWEYIAVRYSGQEAGHKYYEATKHIPRVFIRVTPGKLVTWTGGHTWHPRYLGSHKFK